MKKRRVGIELEFHHMNLEETVACLEKAYGKGKVYSADEFSLKWKAPDGGIFHIELDTSFLHKLSAEEHAAKPASLNRWLWHMTKNSAAEVVIPLVPVEIATPPLEPEDIAKFDDVVRTLRQQGAEGTTDAFYYIFALHFNLDLADDGADDIKCILQAFFLMQKWLQVQVQRDSLRWASRYARLYPEDYGFKLCQSLYRPTMEQLITDYLEHISSRNMALDMLPAFAYLKPEILEGLGDTDLIKPRPAYHYRLPDSRVSDPNWSVSQQLDLWRRVEKLAADRETLAELSRLYLRHRNSYLSRLMESWRDILEVHIS